MPDAHLMTLFAEALERTDPAVRAAYLDAACGEDVALRREVESLLAALAGAGRFLEPDITGVDELGSSASPETIVNSPSVTHRSADHATGVYRPAGPPSTFAAVSIADRPDGSDSGRVIAGRYTLLDVLGEGGMGTVYRADQAAPVKRRVALKLIKVGMDSRLILARFDTERQALAMMDHPNIARVYDGGTTEAGQPFFAMELVDGEPISHYCDRKRLPVRARLELFVAVCQAVQHAHQKGIIHRDLKPGNVLVAEVDGRPTPKVIDFGVAKATEFKLADQTFGDTGAIVGTPAYMSPEQADPASMDIDTRTDVYALGVLLYELLAGSPPIDAGQFRRAGLLEMLRMVREDDPPRPSTKVSTADALPNIAASRDVDPEQLKRALRGDLDWIVMKALEKDRTRRYETANGFAADIQRHLAYEPVQAAPPSRAYRLRKFVRKNRGAVIAASLVLLSLLAGIAGTTWGLFREAQRVKERDEALANADAALGEAKEARGEEVARVKERDYQLGIGNFLLAAAAYDKGDMVATADRLDKVPEGQRGWEWRYLKRRSRGGLFTLYGHTSLVSSVSFSPDGARIVTGSGDETARVWDARTGITLIELKGNAGGVNSACFSPDGTRIVTGNGNPYSTKQAGEARVWDALTGTPLLELKGHARAISSVSFSPDGTRILTGSRDNTARLWDARTGTPLLELKEHKNGICNACFSPDGTRILTGGLDNEARVWDARTGTPLFELKGHESWVISACFSPDGTRIVTGNGFLPTNKQAGEARVWDARTGSLLLELKGHTRGIKSVSFSPDGTRIVTGGEDNAARVWDARSGIPLIELKGHTNAVNSASFSPDGARIVTGSEDKTTRVWDAHTDSSLLELKGHTWPAPQKLVQS